MELRCFKIVVTIYDAVYEFANRSTCKAPTFHVSEAILFLTVLLTEVANKLHPQNKNGIGYSPDPTPTV